MLENSVRDELVAIVSQFRKQPSRYRIGDLVRSVWRDGKTGTVHIDRGVVIGAELELPIQEHEIPAKWRYVVGWYDLALNCFELPWTDEAYEDALELDQDVIGF